MSRAAGLVVGRQSLSLRLLVSIVLLPLVAAAVVTAARQSSPGNRQTPAAPDLALPGRPAPGLAAIILPRHAPAGAYRLTILDKPLEAARSQVMAALAPTAKVDDPPGAWVVRQTDPLDAFGESGIYDRSRLARLFAGKPAQVVRAPVERAGQVIASVTLISPCPDPGLSSLSPGTIAILFDAAAAHPARR